jgi:peptide/nickel transport system substrate-binding protein
MVGLGLTAPLAGQLLAQAGIAQAATPAEYKPTKAGGGGVLKALLWQAPTLLNPHLAVGVKDAEGSRIFYEPLAAWDPDGNLVPVLAAEIPDIENGGVAADGKSVTWKLKAGVEWHDGQPFTADDVVFNWEYAADPETAATSIGSYKDITVEKIDPLTKEKQRHGTAPPNFRVTTSAAKQSRPEGLLRRDRHGALRRLAMTRLRFIPRGSAEPVGG